MGNHADNTEEKSMEWRNSALCKDMGTAIFFDKWYELSKQEKQDIVSMCESCPVLESCYNYAVSSKSHGIWAGRDFRDGRPYSPFSSRKKAPLEFLEKTTV